MQRDILCYVSMSGHVRLCYTSVIHTLKYKARARHGSLLAKVLPLHMLISPMGASSNPSNMLQSYQCTAEVMETKKLLVEMDAGA